jgi:hypothetical protein
MSSGLEYWKEDVLEGFHGTIVWRRWGEFHDQKMILLENSKHGGSDSMGCIFVLLLIGLSFFLY